MIKFKDLIKGNKILIGIYIGFLSNEAIHTFVDYSKDKLPNLISCFGLIIFCLLFIWLFDSWGKKNER